MGFPATVGQAIMPRKLTEELLEAAASERNRRPKGATTQQFLAKVTHLHLNEKKLSSIAIPSGCTLPALKVLYCYDNALTQLAGIGSLTQLAQLVAYNNQISTVGDIQGLHRLKKLYLSNNCLTSLQPLAPLVGLEELHASSQRLPPGEALDLAPEALAGMTGLRVLSLANNGLDSTFELADCHALETVNLSKNALETMDAVQPLLKAAPLLELDLRGNGVDERYQLDNIIVACPTISILNGRELMSSERRFLEELSRRGRARLATN